MDFAPPPAAKAMLVPEAREILIAHLRWRTGEVNAQAVSHRQINTAMQVLIDATGCRPVPSATRVPL